MFRRHPIFLQEGGNPFIAVDFSGVDARLSQDNSPIIGCIHQKRRFAADACP